MSSSQLFLSTGLKRCVALAIFRGCHTNVAKESASERIDVRETAPRGDLLWCFVAVLQQTSGCRNACSLDQVAGVMPTSARKGRAKWRGLRSMRLANAPMLESAPAGISDDPALNLLQR